MAARWCRVHSPGWRSPGQSCRKELPRCGVAKDVLSRIDLMRINARVMSRAATMEPPELRTLDPTQLATASLFGDSVHRFVCYDGRLASAASAGNWIVVSPG